MDTGRSPACYCRAITPASMPGASMKSSRGSGLRKEEFLILLPSGPGVRKRPRGAPAPRRRRPRHSPGGEDLTAGRAHEHCLVTLSPGENGYFVEFSKKAYNALYGAKRAGRNRVMAPTRRHLEEVLEEEMKYSLLTLLS